VTGFEEGSITLLRREVKALLEPDEADALARRLEDEVGATAPARVVAVYLDGSDGALARRAIAAPQDCVKLRVKCYGPDLDRRAGRVVVEVKRERGGITTKERTWTERGLARRAIPPTYASIAGLAPCVATSYLRTVHQRSQGWRVTLDREVAFHAAGWELFDPEAAPWAAALARPFSTEPRVVLELKYGAPELPAWLEALARSRGAPYSKFTEAVVRIRPFRSLGA